MEIIAIMGSPKGKGSGCKIVKMIEDRMKVVAAKSIANVLIRMFKDIGPGDVPWPNASSIAQKP